MPSVCMMRGKIGGIRFAPQTRNNFYVTRDTFDIFHRWDEAEMLRAKWVLMVAIVMCFFVLDALFLRAVGVGDRWKLLLLVYAASGLVVAVFWALMAGEGRQIRDITWRGRCLDSCSRRCPR